MSSVTRVGIPASMRHGWLSLSCVIVASATIALFAGGAIVRVDRAGAHNTGRADTAICLGAQAADRRYEIQGRQLPAA